MIVNQGLKLRRSENIRFRGDYYTYGNDNEYQKVGLEEREQAQKGFFAVLGLCEFRAAAMGTSGMGNGGFGFFGTHCFSPPFVWDS